MEINSEGRRLLVNLAQHYDVWRAASRHLEAGRLIWKTSSGRQYLCRVVDDRGSTTSLGPRSPETEKTFDEYRLARETKSTVERELATDVALYRALRLPMLPDFAGDVLRRLDIRGWLGTSLFVIGSNAIVAYQIEAGQLVPTELTATRDFDLTWVEPEFGKNIEHQPNALLSILKSVDATYTVNAEREFQVRNARGDEVELLLPARLADKWDRRERLQPSPLPEQDWLLNGTPVSHVACDLRYRAAWVVAPDPRYFGLHKLWLAKKPGRDPLKTKKDRQQGMAVLDLVAEHMPSRPMDDAFRDALPSELRTHFEHWKAAGRAEISAPL